MKVNHFKQTRILLILQILAPPSVDKPTDNVKTEEKNLPYEEPLWSGLPQSSQPYILEILKNGAIIDRINLMERPFWVFGRLNNCHICMQHPTISRFGNEHANYEVML